VRTVAALLAVALLLGAVPVKAPAGKKIAIAINGERLALDPPPKLIKGSLLVPVRRIIEGLGLDFAVESGTVVTHVGANRVTLRAGQDGAREFGGVLYAPLRFFTDVLLAQATFDRKAGVVSIVAQFVGRSGNGIITGRKSVEQIGTVTAIDVDSDPPTITISHNASVRTTPIAANATILLEDVNANVTVPGELTDVRPGDYAHLFGPDLTSADRVVDQFGSRVGTVAAVAGGQLVLDDGHVIVPARNTRVSINGAAAAIDDVHAGDSVAVRYNVVTNEVREILAGRTVADTGAPSAIASVETDAVSPLRARAVLNVTLRGTAGGAAQFDVGPYVAGLAMSERQPGVYTGSYRIPDGANFADVPIIGHLRAGGVDYAKQAPNGISASSSPPGIDDVAPDDGAVVNSQHPAIYATFVSDAVAVNPSSIHIVVNGHDITASAVRTPRFVHYVPLEPYPDGRVRVSVRVADDAGNVTSRTWSFVIRSRQ